ncbi:GD20465 [Drosophila simulans]|uniref:GD20465 n=1 Tax=Drosophila simulans TaxID=7240 RepID=B4R0J4_DROSI|nr:GD20465 [Drosophila simulans]
MENCEEKACVICGTLARLMCQRCGEPYCKEECQRYDWQRHKYFCIVMPPLVAIRPLQAALNPIQSVENQVAVAKTHTKSPIPCLEPTAAVPNKQDLSKNWQEHLQGSDTDFFECRVTFIENDGAIWVVDVANVETIERMTANMQRCMQNKKLIRMENVQEDTLVSISVGDKVHRGQVLKVCQQKQVADVRMIDYGLTVATPFRDIYTIVPKMAENQAFAFRVKLPTNTGVQVNKNLTLRLLGTKTRDGVYHAHLKPKMIIPLSLPLEMLQLNPEVKVIRVFKANPKHNEPQLALLQINVMGSVNAELNCSMAGKPKQAFTLPFPEEKCTFFAAARTKDGYRRAFLLDHIVKPTPTFLVYEMDEGRVSITTELSRIPSELLDLPIRVFAAQLEDSVPEELQTQGAELAVKFKLDNPPPKEKLRSANAALNSKGEQICMARLSTFLGQISNLGHKYWREPIVHDSIVFISHLVSFKEVYISTPDAKQYAEIFKHLEYKCAPINESCDVSVGSIVLVVSKQMGHFRGEILSNASGMYEVKNVDTGATQKVELAEIRRSCRFLENLPVYLMRVQLQNMCNIPDAAVPVNNAATQMLHKLCAQEELLKLNIVDATTSTADLLFSSGDSRSLTARLLPLIFTPIQEKSEVAPPKAAPTPSPLPVASRKEQKVSSQNLLLLDAVNDLPSLPPSPPESPSPAVVPTKKSASHVLPIERFLFNDLPKNLAPLADKVNLILMNADGLPQTGYITAAYFKNGKEAEEFNKMLSLAGSQGACDHNAVPGYVPNVGELCLALFSEDKSWYRGVCQKVKDNMVKILFLDFGNTEYVAVEHLKPISHDLIYAVNATKCYIEGFDKSKNFAALEQFLLRKAKFSCGVKIGPEPDTRLITIPDMEAILNTPTA